MKACISLTGPFDFAEAFDRAPGLTRAAFIARSFTADEAAARAVAERMSLAGVAQRITCPLYIVGGRLDRVIPPDHAERLAGRRAGRWCSNMVEDGGHVANNRPYKYRPQSPTGCGTLAGYGPGHPRLLAAEARKVGQTCERLHEL